MMYALLTVFIATTAGLLFLQWVWLERKHNRRHHEMRAKYTRYKARAEEMLASSKLRNAGLQAQLTGARLEAQRAEQAYPKTVIQTRTVKPALPDSLLMMFNDESRPMGYESGFAVAGR